MSRHRDPAGQRRRRDNAWNRLDDRMVTRGWVGGISLAVVGAVVCSVVAAGTAVAPDVTARATVPLPTAARSVTVEVSYDPAPSMSIGVVAAEPSIAAAPTAAASARRTSTPATRTTAAAPSAASTPTATQAPPATSSSTQAAATTTSETNTPAETTEPTETTAPTSTETDPPPTDVLDQVIDDVTEPEETP